MPRSSVYDWENPPAEGFEKTTVFKAEPRGIFGPALAIFRAIRAARPRDVFFSHYQKPYILLAAWACRLVGIKVFSMHDSKFDDFERHLLRELGKTLFLHPYNGSLVASPRCADYIRFLGIPKARIEIGVYALDADRVIRQGRDAQAKFEDRPFIVVSRLVEKKNLQLVIRAFARLPAAVRSRRLLVCGSGPLEGELRQEAEGLGVASAIDFKGFVQAPEVAELMARSLCLVLPSKEEQFGQVVEEAQALGLPTIVTPQCGAADEFVRSGVNGFIVEPDNVEGLAWFMEQIATQPELRARLSAGARANRPLYDVGRFVAAVERLTA